MQKEIITMRPDGFVDHLKQLISENVKGGIIAEIGCYQGESSALFAEKAIVLICVDPWSMGYDPADGASDTDMKAVENAFDQRMSRFDNIRKMKMTSLEAAQIVKDRGIRLDMIYVDGCHTYEAVKADLEAWVPLIKEGGIIAGHDYWLPGMDHSFPGVVKAVDEVVGKPDKVYGDSSWVKYKI